MRPLLAAVALLTLVAPAVLAQSSVRVRDAGPGAPGRLIRAVLEQPHVIVRADTGRVVIPRDSAIERSIVVLGGDAVISAQVAGDVLAIGGDVFLRPGAVVSGQAIAVGGGVYVSSLASAAGSISHRDVTFDMTLEDDVVLLDYRDVRPPRPFLTLPFVRGIRLPSYNRVDGLVLPAGPLLAYGRFEAEPMVTYRSHIGAIDPSLRVRMEIDRRTFLELDGRRTTQTNDRWIRGNFVNSLSSFALGTDVRNYYRADLGSATLSRRWEGATLTFTPFVRAQIERAWSTGPRLTTSSAPYSIVGRRDREEGMLRPNPIINPGRITSAFLGTEWRGSYGDVDLTGVSRAEVMLDTPTDSEGVQWSTTFEVGFPTFRDHTLDILIQGVLTTGDFTPRQRYWYLGGSGTLPTFPLLSFGGDQLLFAEGLYLIPIRAIELPLVGNPSIGFRYMVGSAGVGSLPPLEQNLGLRLQLVPLKLDFTYDPASGDRDFSLGITIGR